MEKVCIRCNTLKPFSDYRKRSSMKDGHRNVCRVCENKRTKERLSNPLKRESWLNNHRKRRANLSDEKKEQIRQRGLAYAKRNKHMFLRRTRERQLKCKNAIPKWVENDFEKFFMKEIYHLSKLRSELTGVDHQVDHIVPITSDLVCGLHCSDNLRIITRIENQSKGNRHWQNMP